MMQEIMFPETGISGNYQFEILNFDTERIAAIQHVAHIQWSCPGTRCIF